ncbi:MAG: DUF4127 family protein [Bacilli bacterium]|nr:DUF4127 family protein [Bacilli bacterium]
MKTILYLPLDERPCNYELPFALSKCAKGYKMIRPSKSAMGDMKIPTPFENVSSFLRENVSDSDIAVISLDQLLYGGIVPSRIHYLTEKDILNRLSLIKDIKEANPNLKIYLFALVLRCPCYSTDEEEPLFYGRCGQEIFEYGVLKSKRDLGIIPEEEYKVKSEPLLKKCGSDLSDFEQRRNINLFALKQFIKNYSKYVDLFVIPQDDSEPYGYAMMDRMRVSKCLDENGVKALMYPGADEVGMVLLARALSDDMGIKPDIEAVFPKEECKEVYPMYEAQPVYKTMQAQLKTIGFNLVEKSKNKLFMNYPTKKTVNMGSAPNESYAERDLPTFVSKIVSSAKANDNVMICDGAYCNGGEEDFLFEISKGVSLFKLCGYAGWNTSSNAMGTVLAQGMLAILFGHNQEQEYFLSERIYEDIAYCGHVRWDVWHGYAPEHGYSLEHAGSSNGIVAKEIRRQLENYMSKRFPEVYTKYALSRCRLPWRRLFEVDLKLRRK